MGNGQHPNRKMNDDDDDDDDDDDEFGGNYTETILCRNIFPLLHTNT